MQVFCPFPPDLARCPEEIPNAGPHALGLIDNRRLRNQVFRETKTLLSGGWKHHPAARFPKTFLLWHANLCLDELDRREAIGIADLIWWKSEYPLPSGKIEFPENLPAIAESHRIALSRKLWIEATEDKSTKQRMEAKMRIDLFASVEELQKIFTPTAYVWPTKIPQ